MKWLIRVVIVLVALAGFAYLFLRSVRDARSEAYTVGRQHLQQWTLAVETSGGPASPLVVARPPQQFSAELFRQIFSRMMESLRGSTEASIPLVLRGEYELSLAGVYTPMDLIEMARSAGLNADAFVPTCVALKRVSEPGLTRQWYYVLFDSPAFSAFRAQIGRSAEDAAVPFDPSALAPIMIVAATDAAFESWLPTGAGASADCIAPIEVR